jgi:hypothetical protein
LHSGQPTGGCNPALRSRRKQGGNAFVAEITSVYKQCYDAFQDIPTAETRWHKSITLHWPAPSIIAFSTPGQFWVGVTPADVEGGFLNRWLILPIEQMIRPPEQMVDEAAKRPPEWLKQALNTLPRQKKYDILDRKDDELSLLTHDDLDQIPWGEGARDIYSRASTTVDEIMLGSDRRRAWLAYRICENSARAATIVAVCRGAEAVEKGDISWALALVWKSFETAVAGSQNISERLDFSGICSEILDVLQAGELLFSEINRKVGRKQRYEGMIQGGLKQLIAEDRIIRLVNRTSGRTAISYRLKDE